MPAAPTQIDDLPNLRKRLRYRAWHRGTREMDLILGPYADSRLQEMDADVLTRFEDVLEENDIDLLAWITHQKPVPADADCDLIAAITEFQSNRTT